MAIQRLTNLAGRFGEQGRGFRSLRFGQQQTGLCHRLCFNAAYRSCERPILLVSWVCDGEQGR
jgi:hypothetical protein